ncbi:MAG: hypothetical protein OXU62_09600 [Gammaproteobacteria bacterium]|nr:hypothetical protein [Gammaproteobacteria bacterium]
MKRNIRRLLISLVFVANFSSPLYATETYIAPIEGGAFINYKVNKPKILNALVALVKLHGYRCDSISAARPFVFSRGFTLICNHFSYEYEIEDKGGNWVVTVD